MHGVRDAAKRSLQAGGGIAAACALPAAVLVAASPPHRKGVAIAPLLQRLFARQACGEFDGVELRLGLGHARFGLRARLKCCDRDGKIAATEVVAGIVDPSHDSCGVSWRVLPFSRAHVHASFCIERHGVKCEGGAHRSRRGGAFVSFCASRFALGWVEQSETHHLRHEPVGFAALNPPYETNERTWNADRRCSQPAVLLARPRLQQKAHAYRRSTAALPWRLSLPRCNFRPCFRGLGLAPILSHPPSGGRSVRSFCGRYPPSPVPRPASTSRPGL